MKLKKLEITGFKSFNEKIAIEFPSGISAIVGPNGCGKSNVIDAIRWVMGEQSVKQLRGKTMDDVIFSGANGQSPLNMAEVSLTLLNDNGSAPEALKDFTEIMLTRRVYRSGERAYFINKQPCRLKDIYNIFYGSGLGPKSYAVIQQGNIGAITDADPEERRYFIEEAAGVTRYKNRKKEALRKVESTHQNLLRLNDILSELKRQMTGLKRQAKKAERFKKFQDRIRVLDGCVSVSAHDRLTEKIRETDELLKGLKDEDMGHSAQLKKIDAAVEKIKLQKERKSQEIAGQKSELFEKQRQTDKMENDLLHHRETIDRLSDEIARLESTQQELETKNADILSEIDQVQQQHTGLQDEIQTVKSRLGQKQKAAEAVAGQMAALTEKKESDKSKLYDLVALEAQYKNICQNASNSKESIQRRMKGSDEESANLLKEIDRLENLKRETTDKIAALRGDIQEIEKQIADAKTELHDQSQKLGEQIKRVQTLELERNQSKSKYTTLKKMEDNFEWYRDGVKAVMRMPSGKSESSGTSKAAATRSLVADILEPEPDYEIAVDAVLGESLQYVVVDSPQAGADAIVYLQAHNAGRSGFIPISAVSGIGACKAEAGPAPVSLLDHIRVAPGYEKVAEALLGHVAVAADMAEAMAVQNQNGGLRTIVTRNGDVVSHQGIMLGGSQDKLSGILAKKKEMKELKKTMARLEEEIAAAQQRQKEMESGIRNCEDRLQKRLERKQQSVQLEIETEKALYKATEDLKHARHRHEIVSLEMEQLRGEASDLEKEMTKYNRALSDVEGKIRHHQAEITETSKKMETVSIQMEDLNQQVVDLKLELGTINTKIEHSHHTLRRLEEFENDTRDRFGQISREIVLKSEKIDALQRRIEAHESGIAAMHAAIKTLEEALSASEVDFREIDARLEESDVSISEIQTKREALLQKTRLLELDRSEQCMKRENIENRLQEQYRTGIEGFKSEFRKNPEQMADDLKKPIPELEAELNRYRDRISRITDVNLAAIKEYDQLAERCEFLTGQRDDLVQAIEDLHQVIRKINKITQERFLSTFDAVNEKLAEVFPRLFEGGSAKLVLTEPETPLLTGVELMIHPPGKKLTRLSLLSGGEKALSAIAFIFAIFLIKPASFCLLDEIDAPLDDANIYRFNNLLKLIGEKSQIVMITHNKKSMEFADTLFGITMANKGISKIVSVDLKQHALSN